MKERGGLGVRRLGEGSRQWFCVEVIQSDGHDLS